jgi:hypothetical protein
MKQAIWNRVGPASGVMFFVLLMGGAGIHGYPDIRPSDSQLANWLANVDVNRFMAGANIEAIGVLFFLPFAAWLYSRLRQGPGDASFPAVTMLAAGVGWVAFTLPLLGAWAGLADQARKGLDVRVAQTVVSINQASYDLTAIVLGLTVLAAGVAIVRGRSMSRWAGWAAIIIGVLYMVTLHFGVDATLIGLLGYLWILAVAGYYTFRPGRERQVVATAGHQSMAAGMPATR